MTPYDQKIAQLFNIRPEQVAATIALLDGGNTVPFIARYRKEATLNLDELLIRQVAETVVKLRAVDDRRTSIRTSIADQGKLTPALAHTLDSAETLTALEDIYAPYKPKRKTRATTAREKGLQPLADALLSQNPSLDVAREAARYLTDDVPTVGEALAYARDILAEIISENATVRARLREKAQQWGVLSVQRVKNSTDEKETYALYYAYTAPVKALKPYQVLAINRGETEKILRVSLDIPERDWRDALESAYRPRKNTPIGDQLALAITDSAERLLLPAIERDTRRQLTDHAENHAIEVFASNMRGLLNQPPLANRVTMGIDPGFRSGCKIAVVDASGKVLATTAIYPHEPQRQHAEALLTLGALIRKHQVSLLAIGNGTASRETEALVAEITRAMPSVQYVITNEAGASVYSASDLARAEMPDLDVTLRGAVSIARRVQDPLAELVKIDPKSIGVGMYQHDVDQKALGQALDAVVESVVNQVGVDVNSASPALLQHVAGIGQKLAGNIVAHRDAQGVFASRAALKKVAGMGPKAYEQAAGFLRVRAGKELLDASAIHPESYASAREILKRADVTAQASSVERDLKLAALRRQTPLPALAQTLSIGELTLADIFEQLARPGRDPREDLPAPLLRSDVLSMKDLQTGMELSGTVRNVVDFGAFVDIGVKQDGLLHKSELPAAVRLSVGDVIRVTIRSVDEARGRIGLGWQR